MNFSILFLFLVAHLSGDFIFQSNKILETRYSIKCRRTRILGNVHHVLKHLLILFVLTLYFLSLKVILAILILSVIHFLIDCIKSEIVVEWPFYSFSLLLFLADQVLHFLTIALTAHWVSINFINRYYLNALIKMLIPFRIIIMITYKQRILLAIILLVIGLWVVGIFIRIFFNYLQFKPYKKLINNGFQISHIYNNTGAQDGGLYIGIFERLFIICSIVLLKPEIIGFVLTTKSIARFKKFDDDAFVEKFIIGSFISFISAIIIGILIKKLLIVPY